MTAVTELRQSMLILERQIKPLEYDASRNQIHEHKREQLKQMKIEYEELQQQLQQALTQ